MFCIMPCVLCSFPMHAVSSFRATLQEHMQTYCPLCPPHQEPHMLPTPHTTTTTIITITAAICLFVCYRQLWYSPPRCVLCCYGVLCGTTLKLCCVVCMYMSLKMLFVLWCCLWPCSIFATVLCNSIFVQTLYVTDLFYVHVYVLYCH